MITLSLGKYLTPTTASILVSAFYGALAETEDTISQCCQEPTNCNVKTAKCSMCPLNVLRKDLVLVIDYLEKF